MSKPDRFDWLLLVETNNYAGNFTRPLGACLTGVTSEYANVDSMVLAKQFRDVTTAKTVDKLSEITKPCHYDGEHTPEFGSVWSPSTTAAFEFEEDPSEYFDLFVMRAKAFPDAWAACWEYATKGLKIKRIAILRRPTAYELVLESAPGVPTSQ